MTAAAGTGELGGGVEVLDSRRLGAAWTLDRMWERLGIGAAIRRVAAGRRLDGDAVERVVFALVCQRACEPGSKPAATGWVAQRVAIAGCPSFSDEAAGSAAHSVPRTTAVEMYEETGADGKRKHTVAQIAAEFGGTRPTTYHHLSKVTATTPSATT